MCLYITPYWLSVIRLLESEKLDSRQLAPRTWRQ